MGIVIQYSGNCNFSYITNLKEYTGNYSAAMADLLQWPLNYYSASPKPTDPPKYRKPTCGMYLFAQGSDDKVPYAGPFAKFITDNQLGSIIDCGPVPNPLHYGRPGTLYVWIIDHTACAKWWKVNVLEKWKAKQEEEAKLKAINEKKPTTTSVGSI